MRHAAIFRPKIQFDARVDCGVFLKNPLHVWLIGAVIGSRRRHATALATPWTAYITAGIAAGILYMGIQTVYGLVRSMLPSGTGSINTAVFLRSLPWALLPCFVTLAICRLARLPDWPRPDALGKTGTLWPRLLDGISVSVALLLGYILAVEIILMTDPGLLPPRIAAAMQSGKLRLPIPVLFPLQIMGFIIGFAVVTDVRRAAHARITADKPSAAPELVAARQTVPA